MRQYIIFTYCLLFAAPVFAQVPDAAVKEYNTALQYHLKKKDSLAYVAMHKAIQTYPGYAEAYSTLGTWYFTDRKFDKATEVFVNASRSCKNGQTAFALPLARSLLYDYKPAQAMQLIAGHNGAGNKEWEVLRKQAIFMQAALKNMLKDSVYNLGPRVNTQYPELHPFIPADTTQLYFTRMVNNVDMDCYHTHLDTCGDWLSGGNLGRPTNTPDHEAAQTVSADGHYLFYMRCDNRSENGWDQGGCDLFMAYTADSVWSIGQSFGATINTTAYEGMPCLSPDNRDLYFVSNREGGYGGLDLWVSTFDDGLWRMPRNLGPQINTPGDETAPFIHIDNRTLYFTSDGHPGMGGSDLYYCRKVNDTTWSAPINMGYPINSNGNEKSISVTMDGQTAFFASDRDSTEGNYDLYRTKLATYLQPVPVVAWKGYAYDSLTQNKLNYTAVNISDVKTGAHLYRFVSNRGDGSFMITLPAGKKYLYTADRIGYQAITDTIWAEKTSREADMYIERNIPLLPQGYSAPIHDSLIFTVHFPINSKALSDSDRTLIQTAMEPWLAETGYVVMINGYTDNTGTPMINEQLSAERARIVEKEIMGYGIDELNINTQGWGEADPIASNDTEIGRDRNRRVEVIIRR
ncbi:MAG: PD40 domain-containing protein [Chitinophagales bacterium]|nr:PD40 domain-containing protein [Chitinophagales bacterium]